MCADRNDDNAVISLKASLFFFLLLPSLSSTFANGSTILSQQRNTPKKRNYYNRREAGKFLNDSTHPAKIGQLRRIKKNRKGTLRCCCCCCASTCWTRDGRKVVCIFGRFGFPRPFFSWFVRWCGARAKHSSRSSGRNACLAVLGCVSYQQLWWPLVHGASV